MLVQRAALARAQGQLTLPWEADPLLIVEALVSRARTAAPESLLIPEFGILRGSARIDLAMLDAGIEGWEVKSDLDDPSRLPRQVEAYNRVFDRVTLVVGPKNAARCEPLVPAWWGIALATDGSIDELRPGARNPSPEPHEIADLLWRGELEAALRALTGRPVRGTRRTMAQRLADTAAHDDLVKLVVSTIKARSRWRSAA